MSIYPCYANSFLMIFRPLIVCHSLLIYKPPRFDGGVRLFALGLGGTIASKDLNMQFPSIIYIKNTQQRERLQLLGSQKRQTYLFGK